ncbi:YtxH domain-containing protein [Pontibacter anaerobius]|uniref:YtxH domain-containing protein n=1 Tax=Pontibacter anaerobius TaxID=2993940 RepID=A0ABT3RDW1_9BACT|nr:YtxH domain-containing protein [Pontibacter anaerobius]MCX2739696.1 YtxH domain-containing protein [Pontibacter anaerobius]
MRTHMECRSLGEHKSNYSTHESVRQIRQKGTNQRSNIRKSNSGGGGQVVAGLIAGAAAGVIAGMMLAPEKGTVMRKKVSDQATKLGDQVNKGYSSTKGKVSDWTSKMKSDKSRSQTEGNVKKSPYTDTNKWDDQESRNMANTARNTPGV